ncbi:ribosome biogenesis protein Nop16 [Trametes gibbosa]|nr:ribosome biogenesis protein Nop16 [Trametes gibbosa]
MANPRQRRKLRSGSHKPVHHSRRAKKILKKQPAIRGPKVLQDAWDAHRTVRQNYEALRLVATLNPIASGGTERRLSTHADHAHDEHSGDGVEREASTSAAGSGSRAGGAGAVPKGYGKIIRDTEGNVVDIQLADEDEDEDEEGEGEEGAGAGEDGLEEEPDPSADDRLAGWVGLGSDPRKRAPESAGTRVVQELEELSEAGGGRVQRHTSEGELWTLRRLVGKHGRDVEGMARDRRVNAGQRTAGELKRAIGKAGGFAELGLGE